MLTAIALTSPPRTNQNICPDPGRYKISTSPHVPNGFPIFHASRQPTVWLLPFQTSETSYNPLSQGPFHSRSLISHPGASLLPPVRRRPAVFDCPIQGISDFTSAGTGPARWACYQVGNGTLPSEPVLSTTGPPLRRWPRKAHCHPARSPKPQTQPSRTKPQPSPPARRPAVPRAAHKPPGDNRVELIISRLQ